MNIYELKHMMTVRKQEMGYKWKKKIKNKKRRKKLKIKLKEELFASINRAIYPSYCYNRAEEDIKMVNGVNC